MVADLKRELASTLSSRRGGGDSGSSTTNWIPIVVGGTVLIVIAGAYFAVRGTTPRAVPVTAQDTPQQDMAMEFLARNQAISEKILAGQQDLSSQIIQAQADIQKNTKRDIVICMAANKCPNSDSGGGGNIVIQPGSTTEPAQPAQPTQPAQPVQTVDYSAPASGYYDEWQAHYAEMQSRFPEMFSTQWSQCSADWNQQPTPQMNCAALGVYLKRQYGG